MAQNKKNLAQIVESWSPAIKQLTNNAVNESNPAKLNWMCEYAHNHTMALNEAAVGGVSFPFQTLYNTVGVGNAVPASMAGQTAADQASSMSTGSGDKWPSLLPMALQVAARTIGFDLVNVIPFQGPTGVLPFLDYVYAGSKDLYGATPAYNGATANPAIGVNEVNPAYSLYELPHAFRCKLVPDASTTKEQCIEDIIIACEKDKSIEIGDDKLKVQYIGLSRLSGDPMFRILPGQNITKSLGEIFGKDNEIKGVSVKADKPGATPGAAATSETVKFGLKNARLISALEDQLQGFTGSGKYLSLIHI